MDCELEQLQSLGFFGTIKESFKILFPRKKIFTYITLTLILPLSILYLVQIEISDLISSKVSNTPSNTNAATTIHHPLSTILLTLFKSVGFFFYLTFYLLSTAAIVYTIACIYTAKQTTYKNVISVVPIVWKKRLLVTYRCSVPIVLIYNIVAIGILVFWAHFIVNTAVGILVGIWILILYVLGIVYISTIIYFVCKSYHNENIDKSSLSDHLEEYLVDYVKLNRSKDVQLKQQSDSRV
ncbi:hypothetical protein LWI29_013584 [Acer saccharum]|uniref:Uncharacterized protein n=1 Tax=Acer saccharum TaxID=4024 RepID=A0AA39T275_ACESA|nr:hypothetical protein LWI29_013584 [Acer saccharum]